MPLLSNNSGSSASNASIDQERAAVRHGTQVVFGNDPAFDNEKQRLAQRVEAEVVTVGDSDHKTRLVRRLGGGSFGEVYLGEMDDRCRALKVKVAVKVEPSNCVLNFLLHEGNVYRHLEGGVGIPCVHWYGMHGTEYTVMVMDLLGPTLYEHFARCTNRTSAAQEPDHRQYQEQYPSQSPSHHLKQEVQLQQQQQQQQPQQHPLSGLGMKTMLQCIEQMLQIMQHVHQRNIVHRDISPSNFMVGSNEPLSGANSVANESSTSPRQLYLIDFGHAKRLSPAQLFIPATARKRHLSLPRRPMVGTPRFASVFAHMGCEESYRDDMESLGYIWIYLLKGRLPWQGLLVGANENKIDRIAQMKMDTPLDVLCEGLPEEFVIYMQYVRGLNPYSMPEHQELRTMFQHLAGRLGIEYDGNFEWINECEDADADAMSPASSLLAPSGTTDSELETAKSRTPVSK